MRPRFCSYNLLFLSLTLTASRFAVCEPLFYVPLGKVHRGIARLTSVFSGVLRNSVSVSFLCRHSVSPAQPRRAIPARQSTQPHPFCGGLYGWLSGTHA